MESGPFDLALSGVGPGAHERTLGVYILFLQKGEVELRQWGRVRALSAGDVFVCCGWLPLSLHVESGLEALVCKVPAWWAIPRFLDRSVMTPDLYVPHTYFASRTLTGLAETVHDLEDPDSAAQGLQMLADLLRTALAACADEDRSMPRVAGRMGRILQFMIQHIDQPGLSAQDAAAALKCSPRTIYKTCADEGTTFNNMLMEVRLLTAQHHLLRRGDRVSQIAYAVGFSSLSHFSRQFRARFGMPANTYRRLQRTV
ncbi:MAG: helix-turn-helix domain-containing protein [Brevundimonas sp.]